jgi:hypothetical protein
MDDYRERLTATKEYYPFAKWATSGLEQYTHDSCSLFTAVFDDLLQRLVALGEQASENEKIAAFKQAVDALNTLNERDESLIETGEREDLCELCNVIATAAGIDPTKYATERGPLASGVSGENGGVVKNNPPRPS